MVNNRSRLCLPVVMLMLYYKRIAGRKKASFVALAHFFLPGINALFCCSVSTLLPPFLAIRIHEKAPTVRKANYVYTLSQFSLVGALYFSIFDTSLNQKRDKVCNKPLYLIAPPIVSQRHFYRSIL